jgi:hypothetical protein
MTMRAWIRIGKAFGRTKNDRRAIKAKARASHYAAERLESRLLLTTNSWKFDNGGDWDTASLWSLGHVPTATEDVTIPLGGTYTITHNTSAADSFKSLTSTKTTVEIDLTKGSLTQAGDATSVSQISGTFMVSGGATFSVTGGTFTASGPTTLSNANLSATTGGQMLFPDATTYTSGNFGDTIQASGTGSQINLSALTTFGGALGGDGITTIAPSAGGEIDLGGHINGLTQIMVSDATSILGVANVTQLNQVNLTLSSTTTLDFPSVTSLSNANLSVSGGGAILFPSATTYTSSNFGDAIQASGTGSEISLSALTTFGGALGGDGITTIAPSAGGEIDLGGNINGLTQITVSDASSILGVANVTQLNQVNLTLSSTPTLNFTGVTSLSNANLSVSGGGVILFPNATTYTSSNFGDAIQASGTGSRINLSALTTFGGALSGDGITTIAPTAGGEIDLGGHINGLTQITVSDASSILGVANVTQLNQVNLTLSSTPTLDFPSVTSLSNVNLSVSGGGAILFPSATTYTSSNFGDTIQASGTGSRINLPALTSFGGGLGGDGTTNIDAFANGEVDASGKFTGTLQFTDLAGGITDAGGFGGGISAITLSGTGSTLKLNLGFQKYTVPSLSITSGGTLDLTDNELLINYAGGTDPSSTIRQELTTGYNDGAWSGAGIDSSAAATHPADALGYADGADGLVSGLSSGQLEIKYTLAGDLNLDGVVSGDDFSLLIGDLGSAVSGWDQGDLNYDGVVSGDDFALLTGNLGRQAVAAAVALPAIGSTSLNAAAATPTVLHSAVVAAPAPVTPNHVIAASRSHGRKHR